MAIYRAILLIFMFATFVNTVDKPISMGAGLVLTAMFVVGIGIAFASDDEE